MPGTRHLLTSAAAQEPLQLLLFTRDTAYAAAAVNGGMDGIVVDWECRGKASRQAGRDTEINRGTESDLARMRATVDAHLVCRINNCEELRLREIERAVCLGADEIWLPMVRDLAEVTESLEQLDGRAQLGVLVETAAALRLGPALQALPLSRVYIGLNDLHIDTGSEHLFEALVDGSVDRFRETYAGRLGVAGFTHPARGRPVPCRLLLAEMARLACGFAVARRSFRAEVPETEIAATLAELRRCFDVLRTRDARAASQDRVALQRAVRVLCAVAPDETVG